MPCALSKIVNFAWKHAERLHFCQKKYSPHGHTPNAFSLANSNKLRKGTRHMPLDLPKGMSSARVHAACLLFCPKKYLVHGHTPNAFSSAKSDTFGMGKHPMR